MNLVKPRRLYNHPLFIGVVTTLFAATLGQHIAYKYQLNQWIYQRNFEVFKENYAGGMNLVCELSDVMGKRLFGLQRVIWVAKGTSSGSLDQVWDEYYDNVVEWNTKLLSYKIRLKQFTANGDLINYFYDDNDAAIALYREDVPQTIHGKFVRAHRRTKQVFDCVSNECRNDVKKSLIEKANVDIGSLGIAVEDFMDSCVKEVYNNSRKLMKAK